MIGTVSIEVNAKNPNMPLWPLRAYVNSPSSLRLVNVPRKIGSWCISAVRLVVVYPDGGVQAAQCVQTGGVWVGTVEGTATSGTCENGYTVFADGTDENGNSVTGYILGKGDVEILHADGTPSPDPARYSVKLLSAEAEQPIEGDMWPTDGGYVIWQNGQANQLGTPFDQISAYVESAVSAKADLSAIHGDYIEGADGGKIYADRTVEIVEQSDPFWTLDDGTNTYALSGTQGAASWSDGSYKYELTNQNGEALWSLVYSNLVGTFWVKKWTDWAYEPASATSLAFPTRGCSVTWGSETRVTQGELATKSDLPTKTSQLSNDSGFIEQGGDVVMHSLTCDELVANGAWIQGYATSSDLSAKRGLMDMTVKGVPQNDNSASWFSVSDGTSEENAYYYSEGRWESGVTTSVLATSAAVYALYKNQDGQLTNIGEFTLDNDAEAAITYEGVTYSITGYIGDLVVSDELNTRLAALEARIAALEGN